MNKRDEIIQKMIGLRNVAVSSNHYAELRDKFLLMRDKRRAEIDAGIEKPVSGIALIGAPGSGKTTAVEHLLSTYQNEDVASGTRDIVSFRTPSPATLKMVGHMLLHELGYPLMKDKSAALIWDRVRTQLQEQRVLFLHFDEAQDLRGSATVRETHHVVNTLKSLMQTRGWPVGLILSGTHELRDIINSDPQLVRRIVPIEIPRLTAVHEIDAIYQLTLDCAQYVDLDPAPTVMKEDFQKRIMHAADYEFGLAIEITIAAVEEALLAGSQQLEVTHFVDAFRSRSGCLDTQNPFVALDYIRLNVRKLAGKDDGNE